MRGELVGLLALGAAAALFWPRRASAAVRQVDVPGGGTQPRGIRNNNPGNLRAGDNWRGLAEPPTDDAGYLRFVRPEDGVRAMTINLLNQQRRHGLTTIRGIISKYAPPSENDTAAYVAAVAHDTGRGPDEPVDLVNNYGLLVDFVNAIIYHENGVNPYSAGVIDEGINAGLAA